MYPGTIKRLSTAEKRTPRYVYPSQVCLAQNRDHGASSRETALSPGRKGTVQSNIEFVLFFYENFLFDFFVSRDWLEIDDVALVRLLALVLRCLDHTTV